MTTKDTKTPAAFKVRPNALLSTADDGMYADFVASVPEVDREDEIIFPQDYNVEEWKANPVWLWAHDKSSLPIGAGYRPNGTPACDQSEERLVLGCRFSQANPQGTMTYALYKEGTLKMVSVGFIATKSETIPGTQFGHNGPVTRILNPELVECSCVPVGMNRAAMLLSIKSWDGYVDRVGLASVIDKGHLHGEKLPEAMARDLAPFAAKKTLAGSHWAVKSPLGGNKIPKFSSQAFARPLALNHSFGSPFMSKAAAPLSAGIIPGKTDTVTKSEVREQLDMTQVKATRVVDGKAVIPGAAKTKADDDEKKPEDTKAVETKADDNATAPATEETVMPPGVTNIKAAMGALADWCKSMSEASAMSDHPDMAEYGKAMCAKVADAVGGMFDGGSKMFPDYATEFEEPARVAAEYAALAEEPDAAMNNDDEEAEIQAEEGKGDTDDEPKDEKAVGDVVTKADFDSWHTKTFGERTPMEAVEDLLKPYAERIDALEAKLSEHDEALADAKVVLESVL